MNKMIILSKEVSFIILILTLFTFFVPFGLAKIGDINNNIPIIAKEKGTTSSPSSSTTFLSLTDTPSTYAGSSGLCLVVNATGVAFSSCSTGTSFFNATYDALNTTYNKFWYNQTYSGSTFNSSYNALNLTYNKFWYNMSDGTGTGNASWNESRGNALYAGIQWGYNQSLYSSNLLNGTYYKFWYNMSDGTGGNSSWNQSGANLLYAGIQWGYNQTYTLGTYNLTYHTWAYNQSLYSSTLLNTTYGKFWYNMSDGTGTGNASWNQSYADSLYSPKKWDYNQTYSGSTFNSSYNALNLTYNKFWYNMSDGTGTGNASWNESRANSLYNRTNVAMRNESNVFTQNNNFTNISIASRIYNLNQQGYVDILYMGLYNGNGLSIDWDNKLLYEVGGQVVIDYATQNLKDSGGVSSIDWNGRSLLDTSGNVKVNWTNGINVSTFNSTYNALNLTYNKFWYNMSDGVGTGNASWNQSYADSLYSPKKWDYNQSLYSSTLLNTTYGKFWYNQTYSGSTFNSTYNALNLTYNKFWYNMSDGVGTGNASWNQSYANTLYASAGAGNASWNESRGNLVYSRLNEKNTFYQNNTFNETVNIRRLIVNNSDSPTISDPNPAPLYAGIKVYAKGKGGYGNGDAIEWYNGKSTQMGSLGCSGEPCDYGTFNLFGNSSGPYGTRIGEWNVMNRQKTGDLRAATIAVDCPGGNQDSCSITFITTDSGFKYGLVIAPNTFTSIGKSSASYQLDSAGDIHSDTNIIADGTITAVGDIESTGGDIRALNNYYIGGVPGETDSVSYWKCKDSLCLTTCQETIIGGLVTSCV